MPSVVTGCCKYPVAFLEEKLYRQVFYFIHELVSVTLTLQGGVDMGLGSNKVTMVVREAGMYLHHVVAPNRLFS